MAYAASVRGSRPRVGGCRSRPETAGTARCWRWSCEVGGASVSTSIRVLLADDQALVRGALVCLLDIEMPGADGITAAAAVRDALPGVRTLIVTTFGRPGYLRRALEAGASGFVVKDTPARQLADAVRKVQAGLRVV